jgi:hypothetical protein
LTNVVSRFRYSGVVPEVMSVGKSTKSQEVRAKMHERIRLLNGRQPPPSPPITLLLVPLNSLSLWERVRVGTPHLYLALYLSGVSVANSAAIIDRFGNRIRL